MVEPCAHMDSKTSILCTAIRIVCMEYFSNQNNAFGALTASEAAGRRHVVRVGCPRMSADECPYCMYDQKMTVGVFFAC